MPIINGGGGSQPTVLSVTKTLTAANILGLHATPVELVPSPGPGKVLVPTYGFTVFHHGATPYDQDLTGDFMVTTPTLFGFASGDTWLTCGHLGISHGWDSIGILATVFADGSFPTSLTNFDVGDVGEQALVAATNTIVPASGDGTLDVTVVYCIADL